VVKKVASGMSEVHSVLGLKGPAHAAISVPDLDAALAWYRDTLGFTVARTWAWMIAETEGRAAYIERDGFRIELLWCEGSEPPPDMTGGVRDPIAQVFVHGIKHVGLLVGDVDAAVALLEARGVRIAISPLDNAAAGVRFAFFYDLAGNVLELIAPLKTMDDEHSHAAD